MYGDFKLLFREHPTLFAYTRALEGVSAVVLMNFGTEEVEVDLSSENDGGLEKELEGAELVLATHPDFVRDEDGKKIRLRAYEGVLYVRK